MIKHLCFAALLGWVPVCVGQSASPAPWVGKDFEGAPCAGKPQGYGPYDYLRRGPLRENLSLVERFHFSAEVERLERGVSGYIHGDLDYTLRAWPNHHRALNAMMRYQSRLDRKAINNLRRQSIPAAECYMQRAIAFSPGDATSMLLFAIALQKTDAIDEARKVYERAIQIAPNDMQVQYNYALLLVEAGELGRAQEIADLVYEHGFPLPGLKRKLSAAAGR